MLNNVNRLVMAVMDFLLGWLLALPRDVVIFFVAFASAAILIGARRLTTNQDLLRRCHNDRQQLKRLIREAKKRKDRESVRRYRATRNMVALKAFKCEGRPLLVAIVPIALLATWCFQRLEFQPPKANRPIEIVATFPVSAAGKIVHLVPQDGLRVEHGWIRKVSVEESGGAARAVARWKLNAEAKNEPYTLQFRSGTRTYQKELLVGRRIYSAPVRFYDGDLERIEVRMKPVRFLHLVPGVPAMLLPPWLVAYLILIIPLFPLLKRALKVY